MWTHHVREKVEHGLPPSEVLAALVEVCVRMGSERDLRALLDLIATEAARLVGAERASLFLWPKKTPATSSAMSPWAAGDPIRVPAGQGIAGSVYASGETLVLDDAYQDPRFFAAVDRQDRLPDAQPPRCAPSKARRRAHRRLRSPQQEHGSFTSATPASSARSPPTPRSPSKTRASSRNSKSAGASSNPKTGSSAGNWADPWRGPSIMGATPQMVQLRRMIERVAAANITVLVTGESGTGKDLVARSLHAMSPRGGRVRTWR
jgi:hypothetical protein